MNFKNTTITILTEIVILMIMVSLSTFDLVTIGHILGTTVVATGMIIAVLIVDIYSNITNNLSKV